MAAAPHGLTIQYYPMLARLYVEALLVDREPVWEVLEAELIPDDQAVLSWYKLATSDAS